jgi:hypothetical protein
MTLSLAAFRRWAGRLAPVLGGLAVLSAAPDARAEQFVLLDVTFTFTKADADNATPSKSHYYVKSDRLNPQTPVDWTKPVDYRNGRVHVRTEVMDKPAGSAETRWTLCYIARKGIDAGYGCSNTAAYKEEGVWEFEQGMTEWWQNDNIDWTQGIKQMDLVMKDSKGVFAHTMPDPEHWFPTTLRITMIQVSAGSTYDPNQVPGLPNGGSGGGGSAGNAGSGGVGGGASTGGVAGAAAGTGGSAGELVGESGSGGVSGLGGSGGGAPLAGTSSAGSAGNVSAGAGSGNAATSEHDPHDAAGCSVAAGLASRSTRTLAATFLAACAALLRRRRR